MLFGMIPATFKRVRFTVKFRDIDADMSLFLNGFLENGGLFLKILQNNFILRLRDMDTARGRGLRTTLQKCFLLATIMQV